MTTELKDSRDRIEAYLTQGPFGDAASIATAAAAYYRGLGRACELAIGLEDGDLAEARDPVLESRRRTSLDRAARLLQADDFALGCGPLHDYRRLVRTTDRGAVAYDSAPTAGPVFLDTSSTHPAVVATIAEVEATTSLRAADSVGLDTASAERMREEAVALAMACAPVLARSAFGNIRGVVLYSAEQPYSTYHNTAPLLIFVSHHVFGEVVRAAELLLHESLHQQLNDISVTRQLFVSTYDDARSARVDVPWTFSGPGVRHFSADRSFAAFHVYTHQTVLYVGVLMSHLATGTDTSSAINHVVTSWARAEHFRRGLALPEMLAELDRDGIALAAWLSRAVDMLGAVTLPDGRKIEDVPHDVALDPHAAN